MTLIAGLAAASAIAAAGCGGGSDGGAEPPGATSAASTTSAAATTSSAPATTAAPTTSSPATTTPTTKATTTTAVPTPTASQTSTESETAESEATAAESETTTTTTEPPPTTTTIAVPPPEASTVEGLVALDQPLVIAHAGGDQDYPHSTMYAYTQSALAGSDILELDVMLTADGVLIVQHDDTVDRTTEAAGPVNELTLAEIQALDNAHWFVAGLWGDQTLPASEYVFRGVRTHHVLDVEIKLQRGPDGEEDLSTGTAAAEVLAVEIAELGREESVIVACFNDDVLAAFSDFAPPVATTPGKATLVGWFLEGKALDPQQAVIQLPFTYAGIDVVTPDTVARVHDEGLEVWVWLSGTDVVETREFYADLFALGVDGVIAGRPAEAAAALAETAG